MSSKLSFKKIFSLAMFFSFAFVISTLAFNGVAMAEEDSNGQEVSDSSDRKSGSGSGFWDSFKPKNPNDNEPAEEETEVEDLELSEDQLRYFKKLKLDYRKNVVKKNASISLAEIEVEELSSADIVNLQAVRTALDKLAALKTDLRYFRIKTREDMKLVLTEAQRSNINEIIKDLGGFKGKGERFGHHGKKGSNWGNSKDKPKGCDKSQRHYK
jgi:Spy/CpxP family protein refolding chaperone